MRNRGVVTEAPTNALGEGRDGNARNDGNARLEHLYATLLPVVFGYCRSRLPLHDAEDVTAEVFRSAAERLRADPALELNRSWFITAAQNMIIDRWRRDTRWERRLTVVAATQRGAQVAAEPSSTLSSTAEQSRADRVIEALDEIPAMQRAVLLLHYVEGRPVREIATILDRSPTAVDSLLARARRSLAQAMQGVSS